VQTFVAAVLPEAAPASLSSAFQASQTIAESNECVAEDNFSTKLMARRSMPPRHRTEHSRP
jgi:hypothetical protein